MNYKNVIMVAVILAVMAFAVAPASAINSYIDSNPVHALAKSDDAANGRLHVQIRGMTVLDPNVIIFNQADPKAGYDKVDRTFHMDDPDWTGNIGPDHYIIYHILADVVSTPPQKLAPGNYGSLMRFGNNNQPEYNNFTIVAGQDTTIGFMGSAKPSFGEPEVTVTTERPHICILAVLYGPYLKTRNGKYTDIMDLGKTRDVTHYFRDNLEGNTVSATTSGSTPDWAWLNSFGGKDPAPGIEKGLFVTYTINGHIKFKIIHSVDVFGTVVTLN